MNKSKVKRIMALIMIMALVIVVSGGMEAKAATGSTVKLFGIHDPKVETHSAACDWMSAGKRDYKKYDAAAKVETRHFSQAQKRGNYPMKILFQRMVRKYTQTGMVICTFLEKRKKLFGISRTRNRKNAQAQRQTRWT